MDDIVVGVIPPVHNNPSQRDQGKGPYSKKKRPVKKKRGPDDQHDSPEEGVVVTLSYKNRPRNGVDRRKKNRPAQLVYKP